MPAVRAAIVETLVGSKALEGVSVVNGGPEPSRSNEYVWLYSAKSSREFSTIGIQPPPLAETLKLQIRIVAIGGEEASVSEARATELLEAAEHALRTDDTLKATAWWSKFTDLEGEPLLIDQKLAFAYTTTLEAYTRI
jgi:hypothetical protein